MMNFLIAPNALKGSLSAANAAEREPLRALGAMRKFIMKGMDFWSKIQ